MIATANKPYILCPMKTHHFLDAHSCGLEKSCANLCYFYFLFWTNAMFSRKKNQFH